MNSPNKGTAETAGSGVDKSLEQIRSMVISGELLPGEKVQQSALAERLGVSRIPVREALSKLHSEGVLDHRPNTGYTVARFNSEDLSEIYLMRRLLETVLLKSADLAQVDLRTLQDLHKKMMTAAKNHNPDEFQHWNKKFHFEIFTASPLQVVLQELERLWYMSGFYRSMYLYEPETTSITIQEHQGIIEAVKAGDVKALIKRSDAHRSRAERIVVQRLGRSRTPHNRARQA
ncbi:GntR family transcriptional regulator [Amycolatopsis sp. GM8]|uniref:GntR family transcriptional regulator n=1 Tax=Amycolatopsis sp. GM8 TaxID=2896530 RepID=UPI001F33040D|nr:GntR family transcriptional regulator [Amycolatopsis sp. GM8]